MKRRISFEKRRRLTGYVFAAPWILGFSVFMLVPLLMNLCMSFGKITDVVGLKIGFAGLDNYVRLFKTDIHFLPAFFDTLKNTFIWTPFILVFALVMAVLLNRRIWFRGLYRVVFFLPVLLGTGYIMQQVGEASNILALPADMEKLIRYYTSQETADFIGELLARILKTFWQTGIPVIIFLSGLQSIPDTYYEAAMIDNANGWDCFWKITLPMLSPMILLNTVYTVIESFRSTDNKIANLIVTMVFGNADYEYGAAMGWVYFAVTIAVVGIVFLAFRRHVIYER